MYERDDLPMWRSGQLHPVASGLTFFLELGAGNQTLLDQVTQHGIGAQRLVSQLVEPAAARFVHAFGDAIEQALLLVENGVDQTSQRLFSRVQVVLDGLRNFLQKQSRRIK